MTSHNSFGREAGATRLQNADFGLRNLIRAAASTPTLGCCVAQSDEQVRPWGYESATYGDNCADFYDDIYGPARAVVVRALCRLARGGSVLELGVATGRTTLALLEKGLTVTGIESSSAMLDQLRRKPGADRIRVVKGDFATLRLPKQFDLVFALVDTFCLLETRQRQAQCLQHVAEMLKVDGVLVVEAFRPPDADTEITNEGVRFSFRHELKTKTGRRFYRGELLYPEVEDLDALAADAGLVLKERCGDWCGSQYRPEAGCHVSVYGQA